ncbi:hypothetical protein Ahy_B07g087281 isoform C [Arachis hypogaea]|uniref:Aminotransferase-like plant mobile domain-containing protein n=1 Tax=Arachis hypogaea TaxID=3818 RepID=A0A444YBP2_ARAHY|nr:hypothetical protein Ahy_B07g087281 isoform C [Arachis hypogaea]
MTWLKKRVSHISPGADLDTLRKYARCYLMMLIEGFLFTDKSTTLVPLKWLLLLAVVLGSALLAHTYHSLYTAIGCDVTDIAGCMPLVVSWIYHRFLSFCPPE